MARVVSENTLPYKATKENIEKLLEAVVKKQKNEQEIKAIYSGGKYEECKRTLITLELISKDMELTEQGRNIYYSNQNEKELEWYKVIRSYKPYDNFIEYLINNKNDEIVEIDAEEVKAYWGKNSYGASDINIKEGVRTFGNILEISNLGKLIKGTNKTHTRLQIDLKKIRNIQNQLKFATNNDISVENKDIEAKDKEDLYEPKEELIKDDIIKNEPLIEDYNKNFYLEENRKRVPNINIDVNMTDWDIEKIEKVVEILNKFYK